MGSAPINCKLRKFSWERKAKKDGRRRRRATASRPWRLISSIRRTRSGIGAVRGSPESLSTLISSRHHVSPRELCIPEGHPICIHKPPAGPGPIRKSGLLHGLSHVGYDAYRPVRHKRLRRGPPIRRIETNGGV